MASTRADEVAELLWELKRAAKLSTYTLIARRAGFSPGTKGRTLETTLKTVRRDWPHLHWWRAVSDDGKIVATSDQIEKLREAGYELEQPDGDGTVFLVKSFEEHVYRWEEVVVESTGE